MSASSSSARGSAEKFGAEAGDVIAGAGGGDHFEGAAGEAELHGPYRRTPAPVIEEIKACPDHAFLGEVRPKCFIDCGCIFCKGHKFFQDLKGTG